LVYDEPLLDYERKETQFFHEVTVNCLKPLLAKHNLVDKLPSTLKTSSTVYKRNYVEVCENEVENIKVATSNCYDIVDCFAAEYEKTKDLRTFGLKVAAYIKGWWGHVLEGGLLAEGVDGSIVKKVSREFFDLELPKFVSEKQAIYPENFRVLALALQKI
jgi:hypothetical protein